MRLEYDTLGNRIASPLMALLCHFHNPMLNNVIFCERTTLGVAMWKNYVRHMTIVAIGAVTFFINHSSQYSHTLIRTRVLETWSEPTRIYN